MIAAPSGVRVYLACGSTDMRKGMAGLAMQVQQGLAQDPFDGCIFAFRGKRAGLIKVLWHDGIGRLRAYAAFGHGPSDPADQAPGTRPLHLADHEHGCDLADGFAAGDVIGRLRVAGAGDKPQACTGGLTTRGAEKTAGGDAAASLMMPPCRST